jgi:hypothetical protein
MCGDTTMLRCQNCATIDFTPSAKEFTKALLCESCGIVMCVACAGRKLIQPNIEALCCFQCESTGLIDAEQAQRRTPRCI